jgi:hypothetical protein
MPRSDHGALCHEFSPFREPSAAGVLTASVAKGEFKDSPPYLHDGRLLTLEDTVEFFNLVLSCGRSDDRRTSDVYDPAGRSVRCTTRTRRAVDQPNISMPTADSTAPAMRWGALRLSSLAPRVVKEAREK